MCIILAYKMFARHKVIELLDVRDLSRCYVQMCNVHVIPQKGNILINQESAD